MNLQDFRNIPYRMQDLSSVFPGYSNLATKAKRLEDSGKIIRLKRGLYVDSPSITHQELSTYLIANHIHGPSYVSMHTALRYFGLIPEAVYRVQSMTTGVARTYTNALGHFSYVHVADEYYPIGITTAQEANATFMIATPEKALCDLMVYTPNLNLRFQTAMSQFLEEDLRFDIDELRNFNVEIIEHCAKASRKKNMLRQLIKYIEHERNI